MGLRAPIEGRGLTREGAAEPPPYDRADTVAWYRGGPQPGSPGAAVLVGHVDTDRAPAVFYELGGLKRGETVSVDRADGSTAEFTVDDVTVFGKDHFDAGRVYGPHTAGRAELRLITCGGDYDRARRQYSANVVVSAAEKKRMARIVADVPVHDVIVGDGEGQVPLKKVRTTLLKLPRVLPGAQVTVVNDRLRALGDLMSNMPIPKGPMPKGMRMPKGPLRPRK
ncbi:hypothetical protein GCM10020221_26010 [Streptomyces thioluteus]|uniref:Class F sortase n=1 Tax=Streptomyces thioluteus TaxID=66431 RepID=A0ABN3WXD8_STRTU